MHGVRNIYNNARCGAAPTAVPDPSRTGTFNRVRERTVFAPELPHLKAGRFPT